MIEREKIFSEISSETKSLFGDRLLSLAVYGSAATADYLLGSSDINLILVLKETGLAEMQLARVLREKFKKIKLAAPLLMTDEFIKASADVFPIEFFEIQEKHHLLAGKDFFSKLKIESRNLRHECEHELKGRLLRLRQSYIEVSDKPAQLQSVLVSAHQANYPAFRCALRLKKVKPPLEQKEVLEALSQHFKLDPVPFESVRRLRRGELKLQARELIHLLEQYLREVGKLAQSVDRL
jgi:hypothetical protein